MKAPKITPHEPWNSDDLNEWVLEAATNASNDPVAPESVPGNATITTWDESADAAGGRVTPVPAENGETIAEQLVEAGSDEAGQEQRWFASHDAAAAKKR